MQEMTTRLFDITLKSGATLRVMPVTSHVFHLRLRPDAEFPEPGLVRYGIVKTDLPEVAVTVSEGQDTCVFDTGHTCLEISRDDGRVTFRDANGRLLVRDAKPPRSDPRAGFRVSFALSNDDRLYGLGDETRDRIQKRGHETPMILRNVVSYVPLPFLMSTGGWAIFLNSTWFHHVDVGANHPDRLVFSARRGELDYYLIAGQSLPQLLDRYTEITGRPALLPLWAYGLTFVCDERGVRARDVLYEAHYLRKEGIPCDLIGLEPDWMDTYYDFSVNKQWSKERFHVPTWLPHHKPGGFTAALRNMGFKLSLWLCCDYDVSEYEEAQLRSRHETETVGMCKPPSDAPPVEDRYDEAVIHDPHFVPVYQDRVTKLGEPWFEHLKKFVDDGAVAFKMDGSNQICFHPDRKWRNGMDDEEMHNLYPVLLAKQMSEGFHTYTGRRPMIYTAGGYAGIQQYAATWAGDTGGDAKPLISLLNHGLSGHSNTSCDMQVWNPAGIHFGFLQPWSQVLSWHQYNQPWFLPEDVYRVFRFYARLRYRLIPYLYSMAHIAARTGMPIMRAMPLVAPDDPRSDELLLQYMLGDNFLTCAFTETIYLPAGKWIDYWTGEAHKGPKELRFQLPPDRGGPLLVKAGAIIPTWPNTDFVGQVPLESIGLEIFPHGQSEFTLYEDDGITRAYLEGKVATTHVACRTMGTEVHITIAPRAGMYEGMPERRTWNVAIHADSRPTTVSVNGQARDESGWDYHTDARLIMLSLTEEPERQRPATIYVVF